MRRRWQLAKFRAAFERQWRVRPATRSREELQGALELRPLEERRVLSASAALALAQALASSGIEQVEGTTKSPDPATPLGTDAAHHEPIDPGDRVAPGTAAQDAGGTQGPKGPAADNLDETENRSVTVEADVEADAVGSSGLTPTAMPQADVSEQVPLALTVPADQTTNEGSLLSLTDIGKFSDPWLSSQVYTYSIDWGDGTPADVGVATIDDFGGDGMPREGSFDGAHTYADNGTYTVTVSLTPQEGDTVTSQFEVSVNNVSPTLSVVPNQVTTEGSLLNITDIGTFTDPGFDNPLNVGGEVNEKFTYSIDWGDGTLVNSGPGTIDVAGGPGVLTQGSFNGSHTYADNGVYTVTVTVSDDDGGMAQQTFEVTVNNVAPTLTVPPNQVVNEGALLSLTNIGQITDPGFDNPLNVGGEVNEKFSYFVDWGDGTAGSSGPVTIDVPGSAGVPTQGSFDGSHIYADNGVYTVTVTVNDDDGGMTSQTFEVVVNNVAPVLTVAPNQVVNEGSLLAIINIGQFTDPGFDNPLNVGGELTEKFSYSIDWGDGTPGSSGPPTIDVPGGPGVPTQGSFDGSHIYADNGVYTVTVTLVDDDGGMAQQTFEVTVNNVAPTLVVPPNQVVNEGALLSITNIGQFTDPGFDNPLNVGGEISEKFSYSIDWGDGTPGSSGPPTIDVPGSPGVPTQGSFDGSHIYADNGVYTVTVTIVDDDGGMAQQTFEVTVNNVAPTLVVPPNQVVNEGALLSIQNIGQFTDPGFDNPLNVGGELTERFTYSVDWGDGTPVSSGPATIDVAGGPGVPTQGSFDGSHIYADNGVYTVTVTLLDDDGGMAQQTFEVTVNNVAPTLVVPPNQVVNEGSLLSIPNIGQFTDPGFDNPLNVGGELTERFTYSVDWGDGTPASSGPATIDVAGGPGVPTQGSFDGSHIYADNGVYTVTVTVSDDDGGMSVQTFEVTVNNVAPTLVVPPNQVVNEGSLLSIPNIGQFTDPGFDNLLNVGGELTERFTYSVDWGDGTPVSSGPATIDVAGGPGVPTQGSFDGSHIYADNGVYTVTVTIVDDDGGMTQQTFEVTVNNVAPTLVVPGDQVTDEGELLSVSDIGQFSDPGFDNPLNIGGELTERFTYSIDWGDGSPIDSGPAPIDVFGGPGIPTQGSFDGSHTYLAAGTYTVTVTLVDDDGGVAVGTFDVTVRSVAPIIISGPNQMVNEGSSLTVIDIGQFIDPKPGGVASYSYSIDWGDGRPVDFGPATIDASGGEGPTSGSFDGTHTYADNGLYTVTVTVITLDGRSASATLQVAVQNVAPTLTVGGNVSVALGSVLVLPNLGQFGDPGFDNLLNVGGETTERFTVSINWGDGTSPSVLPGVITQPGAVGLQTAGNFDAQHLYGSPGTFTVNVTLTDDDGGVAVGSFEVTVFVIREGLFMPPGGGGGTTPPSAPPPGSPEPGAQPPNATARIDFRAARIASVAGAEPRLVLRVVTPAGIEDRLGEQPLPDEVLDNLRALFKRLPDGHYRIYQIQPDGIERLVVDVVVQEGRSIDQQEQPAVEAAAPASDEPATDASTGEPELPDGTPSIESSIPPAAAPDAAAERDKSSSAELALAVGGVALVAPLGRSRRRLQREDDHQPSLTKAHRTLRRPR